MQLTEAVLDAMATSVLSRQLFEDERAYAEYLHNQEMLLEERQHDAEMQQAKLLHERKLQYDTNLFAHDMTVDVALATRDATRDGIRQCSQAATSVALADVLLLTAEFLLLSQYNLPPTPPAQSPLLSAHRAAHCLWVVGLGVALVALMLSVCMCLRLQRVIAAFDVSQKLRRYPCGRSHQNFNEYVECHCESLESAARVSCVVGAIATVFAACSWAYVTYLVAFQAPGAVVLFWLPSGLGLVALVAANQLMPDATRSGRRDYVGMSPAMLEMVTHNRGAALVDSALGGNTTPLAYTSRQIGSSHVPY